MKGYYSLKNNSFKVMTYIMLNVRKDCFREISLYKTIEELTEELNISVNTFYLARKDLVSKGFISVGGYGSIKLTQKGAMILKKLHEEAETTLGQS